MRRRNRPSLMLEQLDSRIMPWTSRAIGTFQITDITVPTEWISWEGSGSKFGDVVGTDMLRASLDVTYTVTGQALKDAQRPQGLTLPKEEVRWLEEDAWTDDLVSKVRFSVNIKAPPGPIGTFSQTVVIRFPRTINNDSYAREDWWNDAEYYGWFDRVGPVNLRTSNIVLESVAAGMPNTGGTPGNAGLRPTSPGVTVTSVASVPSAPLPVATAGFYRVLRVASAEGDNVTFAAANTSGSGLFAVGTTSGSGLPPGGLQSETKSPLDLVFDTTVDPDGEWVLDPAATLNPVYLDGMATAGSFDGSNPNLVVRSNAGGRADILSGYSYSSVPAALLSLADGQALTVPATDIGDAEDMLWLTYETDAGTQQFVVFAVNPTSPRLTVSDATVTEGNGGTTDATFTVTLSEPSDSEVTVNYSTNSGPAGSPLDFGSLSGTLTFPPGETTQTVTVPVNGDTMFEPNEDFFLTLSSPTNAVIADGAGAGTILNDDFQPTITINDVSRLEGNGGTTLFVFTVTLSNPSWQVITVNFATADGSATAGQDYEATSGTLTFQPGETTKTIVVTVYGDGDPETGGEDFSVDLSEPTNATLIDAQGLGFIEDDD